MCMAYFPLFTLRVTLFEEPREYIRDVGQSVDAVGKRKIKITFNDQHNYDNRPYHSYKWSLLSWISIRNLFIV